MGTLDQWQQELEQERMQRTLEALQRVATGTSTSDDAAFLASELGLSNQWRQDNGQVR
jgi:hypothetical protein